MLVIPAIDLKNGKCVRLLQGKKDKVTVYSDDPVSIARKWEGLGAEILHIVDLDGAFTGKQSNFDIIASIRRATDITIQVGGGIRDIARIEKLLNTGISRVILGTSAVREPGMIRDACERYPGKILIGIDARDGKVAVRGWEEVTEFDAQEFARTIEAYQIAGIIYTDIARDGMMTGPNFGALSKMIAAVRIPVIASGGVSSTDDIRALLGIPGLWGVITGKALYAGTLDLEQAIKIVKNDQ